MVRYRKIPVEIEAVQLPPPDDQETREMPQWLLEAIQNRVVVTNEDNDVFINTREGRMFCPVGNWIIRGVAGEIYSCAPEIFQATYEAI